MEKFEKMLLQADFSKETDLKERLRAKLFGKKSNVITFPTSTQMTEIDLDSLEQLSAAGELLYNDEDKKD